MFQMITNFLETSIAFLSVYDIFIILLFILALVLSIVSGIVVVSSSVKKINVELTKNKSIQNVNDKIIRNRLDLIINKLSETQKNTKSCLDLVNTKNVSNAHTKDVVSTVETSDSHNKPLNNSYNVINLPSQKPLDTHETNNELNTVTQPSENKEPKSTCTFNNVENDMSTNIVLSPENIPDSSHYSEEVPIITVTPENIQLNSSKAPNDFLNKNLNEDKDAVVVNIKDDSDKKVKLVVDSKEKDVDDKNTNKDTNYDVSRKIPLNLNNDIESISYEEEPIENNGEVSYSSTKQKKPLKGISLANHFLNQIHYFTDNEKFAITNYISNSGNCIKCLVNNKLVPLNFKELNRQLIIQRLNHRYKYPLDLLETNFPLELNTNSTKKCDLIVFDKKDNPYIICVISFSELDKNLNLINRLLKVSDATFGIFISNKQIQYYQNSRGKVKEIDDIPTFNKKLDSYKEGNSSQLHFISAPKNSLQSRHSRHFYKSPPNENSRNPDFFDKDKYNIYRKNPYSVSDEYLSIIEKYRNLNPSYKNMHTNFYSSYNQDSNNIPSQQGNYPLSSNITLNLNNNNPRDLYMNRYTNIHNPSRTLANNITPNYNYRNHFQYRYTANNNNVPPIQSYIGIQPPHVNINNFSPRPFVSSYNSSMSMSPINNIPMNMHMPYNQRPIATSSYMMPPSRVSQNSTPIRTNTQPSMGKQNTSNTVTGRGFQSYKNLASNYTNKAVKPHSVSLFNTRFKLNK